MTSRKTAVLTSPPQRTLKSQLKLLLKRGGTTRSPLAGKLLGLIFALYFSIAFVITGIQLAVQYHGELNKLQAEIDGAAELVLPAISKTLWDYDKDGIQAVVQGLSRNKAIIGLELEGGVPITIGILPKTHNRAMPHAKPNSDIPFTEKLYEQRYPVRYKGKLGDEQVIGALKVYSSSSVVISRGMDFFITIILTALAKTIALWLILYFTIKLLVARPIGKLALGLNKINHEHNGRFDRGDFNDTHKESDELGFLLRAFINMRKALKRSQSKLLAHQQELERKIEERTRELHYQAMHDELTGLLNRRALETTITSLARNDTRAETQNVLCLIDLDHFKLVNDTFGHAAGDRVLKQVADILKRSIRPTDIAARTGGDEFAIILPDCAVNDAQMKIEALAKQVKALIVQSGSERVAMGFSAGLVSFSTQTISNMQRAMLQADAACYSAKENGRHQIKVFGEAALLRRKIDINWVNVINLALNEERFLLYAQPIMAADSSEVRQLEILIRLDLDGEIILPGNFMPAAERYNLATKIDAWVFSHTLAFLSKHRDFLERIDCIHINLGALTVSDVGFYRFAVKQLRRYKVPPHKICFEVTESTAIANMGDSVRIMNGLRKRGITFALDDFGRGMSSYVYLQTLPIDKVKIDGSFVRNIIDNPVSAAIVSSINEIAHMAGKVTVAEFVESAALLDKLRLLQVDYMQGFYLGKPLPLESFTRTK